MFIEFVGPSGAGKSTIYRHFLRAHARDLVPGDAACYAALLQQSRKTQGLGAYIKTAIARHQAKKTGDIQLLKAFGISADCVELCNVVFEQFRVDPNTPQVYFERLRRFQSVLAYYSALNLHHDSRARPVIFDEFFAQKCIAMSLYAPDQPGFIADFTDHMPKAALYIYVESPPDVVKQRVIERGNDVQAMQEFDANYTAPNMLLEALDAGGQNILHIDGTRPVAENLKLLCAAVFEGATIPTARK